VTVALSSEPVVVLSLLLFTASFNLSAAVLNVSPAVFISFAASLAALSTSLNVLARLFPASVAALRLDSKSALFLSSCVCSFYLAQA